MTRFSGPVVGGYESKTTVAVCSNGSLYDATIPANLAKLEKNCRGEAIRVGLFQQRAFSELPFRLMFAK